MTDLFSPLTLPNGTVLPNRICKAAMEENMAEFGQLPGQALHNLYRTWGKGTPGLILTGNVMVDPQALTGPGGVVLQKGTLDDADARARFEKWSSLAKAGGSKVWMQISHPGRQVYASQGTEAVSASATKVAMQGAEKMFATARALTSDEIEAMVTRFADTSEAAEACGFDGVEIHAAHGYLVAQFLSPLSNHRDDKWGGSLENRARFLLEIIKAVRARVSPEFGVSVKLNSADFQRGGFDIDDARQVVEMMNDLGVDLVELSGGNYESAAMMGMPDDERFTSTEKREMYFVDFAKDIRGSAKMPLMVTGGVTKRASADAALAEGNVDVIGIARAFAYAPHLPKDWETEGASAAVTIPPVKFKNKLLAVLGAMSKTKVQLHRMGAGDAPKPSASPLLAIIKDRIRVSKLTKRYRKWLDA
ncbi:MAG: NADH:flavin oxidoreductase/NADH oxidase family protein [Maricaulaceae bacterium]